MSFRTDLKNLVLTKWGAAAVILVLLLEGTVYLSLYTQAVIPVMKEVCGNMWCYLPGGSFFPFPRPSGFIVAPVVTPMSPLDQFIYRSLLKTGLIFDITLIWWIGTLCYGLLLGMLLITKGLKTLQTAPPANEDKEKT